MPFTVTLLENPANGIRIGFVNASTSDESDIIYSLTTQSVSGAMAIDATTGELTVADSTAFDFEISSTLTATFIASSGDIIEEGDITLTIIDADETAPVTVVADDFTGEIAENPQIDTSLGIVNASASDGGTIAYSLTAQSVSGALAIDAITGELTVADSAAFDFEINTSLTATYTAISGSISEEGAIVITITDVEDTGFVTTWETTSANESITIPTDAAYTYNYNVDWGDGSSSIGQTDNASHEYASPGTYKVTITAEFPSIRFGSNDAATIASRSKIQAINKWGANAWQSMRFAFEGCENLILVASDTPDLSQTTSTNSMFRKCDNINSPMNDWEMGNVTDMRFMFSEATSFNQEIGDWDVSKVTFMHYMFFDAPNFNQDINNWDVTNVTTMQFMFSGASSFNKPLNNWKLDKLSTIDRMFQGATDFNQDISDWNVSKVKLIYYMFQGATSFNQSIEDWDVSNVTNMVGMFAGASSFNQPLNDWDVSNVGAMFTMFSGASSFDQPLNAWDVSNVTNMSKLFLNATEFDQDLSGWDVESVIICSNFSDNSGLSGENLPLFTNCNPE